MLIPNLDLEFRNPHPKIHFWANWFEKNKVLRFAWKVAYMVSWRGWICIRTCFSKFQPQNPSFGKFGWKKSKFYVLPKTGTNGILEELILHPDLDFHNSDTKIHFWANLGRKSQSCPFYLKICTKSISKMLILIPTLAFWISNLKSIFG